VFATDTSVLIVPARESVGETKPFETVLVPVDCTPRSDWTVTLAARLARAQGAELVVLHVVTAPKLLDPQGTARESEIVDEIVTLNRDAASRYVEALARRLESPELSIRALVDVADEVAPALERHATAEPRPLLVLGARGRPRFDDGPFGALVAVTLANTGHPVLVLREPSSSRLNMRRWATPTASAEPGRAPLTVE
jgi:nucleotide-binding universal stress UspA family protein